MCEIAAKKKLAILMIIITIEMFKNDSLLIHSRQVPGRKAMKGGFYA
jgi:hypothetical protein